MTSRLSAPQLALALGLSLLVGCGSTVQQSSEVALGGEQVLGGTAEGVPDAAAADAAGDVVVAPGGTVPGAGAPGGEVGAPLGDLGGGSTRGTGGLDSAGATPDSAPTGGSAGAPRSGTAPAGAGGQPAAAPGAGPARSTVPAKGRGWDEQFAYIGVTTQKDVQTAADSVGAEGLDAGDQEAQALAIAAEVNRRGGVLGRKVKIVFKDQQTVATAQDPNTAGAAACTYFTQDRPVIALLNPVTLMDVPSFRACMAKAKVPLFSASVAAVDKKVGQDLAPYFYQSVAPSWDALAPVLLARLQAQGWFSGWDPRTGTPGPAPAKVGVLVGSTDVDRRVGQVVTRALRAAGRPAPVVFASNGDFNAAVLQFGGNGVTHVISTNADLFAFQLSAASQNYRPRYGIHSLNAPVTFLETNSPEGQNRGAIGVGWSPSLDVNDSNDVATGPGEKECRDVLARAGQTFSRKRLAEAVALAFCDGIRLIATGANTGGGFSGVQVFEGVQQAAPTFRPGFGFGNGLTRSTLFLPGAVRDLRWDDACDCAKYAGSTVTPLVRR